jgi:hypothetical protein
MEKALTLQSWCSENQMLVKGPGQVWGFSPLPYTGFHVTLQPRDFLTLGGGQVRHPERTLTDVHPPL